MEGKTLKDYVVRCGEDWFEIIPSYDRDDAKDKFLLKFKDVKREEISMVYDPPETLEELNNKKIKDYYEELLKINETYLEGEKYILKLVDAGIYIQFPDDFDFGNIEMGDHTDMFLENGFYISDLAFSKNIIVIKPL